MRRSVGVAILAVVGLAAQSSVAGAATVTVNTGFTAPATGFFSPNNVTVAVGDTVTVVNAGGAVRHSLVWADGAPGFAEVPPPSTVNSDPWSSSRTFSAPGDFAFSCSVHPTTMTGVVHVPAPAPAPGAPAPTPAPGAPAPTPTPQADRTAPSLTASGRATRRRITLRVRLSEAARLTVVVTRGRRTLARKRFTRRAAGRATLRVPVRTRSGRVTVRITAVDAAGNTSRRSLRLRVR
jgi:plastocyanin